MHRSRPRVRGTPHIDYAVWAWRRCTTRLQPQVLEQHLLLPGQEAQLQPAENVIHDRLGKSDFRIVRPTARLKAGVRKLFAEQLQRYSVLQRDRHRQRETV